MERITKKLFSVIRQILPQDSWDAFIALRQPLRNLGHWGHSGRLPTRQSRETGLQESLEFPRSHLYCTGASPRAFRSRSEVAEGELQPFERAAPTWLTPEEWQSTQLTYSLNWHLNSPTGNPSFYLLSLPLPQLESRKEGSVCIWWRVHHEISSKRRPEEWTVWPGSVLQDSFIIETALRHKGTKLHVKKGTETNPSFYQEQKSKSYSRSHALETWSPRSRPCPVSFDPIMMLPFTKQRKWNPSVS